MCRSTLVIICLSCLSGSSISAQGIRSSTAGFSVKAGPIWETWASSSYYLGDVDSEAFLGGYLGVAFGFGQRIEAFSSYRFAGGYTQEGYDSYRSRTILFGARTHFGGTLRRVRPWLEAAFAWQTLQLEPISYYDDFGNYLGEFSLGTRGAGVEAGIGVQYFLTPTLSLDFGVRGRFGGFSTIRIDGAIDEPDERVDFRFLTVGLGLAYFLN
ncbi:MAG: hypothetical protein K9I85_15935 [Saprospiraceae bacterium]|nr:hypothetical protein [Saprospiraceae bacterium]